MNFVKKYKKLFDIKFQKLEPNMIKSLLNPQINEEKEADKDQLNKDFLK